MSRPIDDDDLDMEDWEDEMSDFKVEMKDLSEEMTQLAREMAHLHSRRPRAKRQSNNIVFGDQSGGDINTWENLGGVYRKVIEDGKGGRTVKIRSKDGNQYTSSSYSSSNSILPFDIYGIISYIAAVWHHLWNKEPKKNEDIPTDGKASAGNK